MYGGRDYNPPPPFFSSPMNSSPEAKNFLMLQKLRLFLNSEIAFHVQTYPDSQHELTLIQIAKQLRECCFQMVMDPGKTH